MSRRTVQYSWSVAAVVIVIVIAAVLYRSSMYSEPTEVRSAGTVAESHADQLSSEPVAPRDTQVFQFGTEQPITPTLQSETHAWCTEDARQPGVIERIAHNPSEVARMVEENDRISRRQLVYRKDPVAWVVQRSKANGEPIRRLTLPGLDGQELEFEVERADLSPSGQSGSFQGHLVDWPDSMVTLAFKFGREAFSVSSPWNNLYLEAEPREPGQVVIKEIDPDTFVSPSDSPDFIENKQANTITHNQVNANE